MTWVGGLVILIAVSGQALHDGGRDAITRFSWKPAPSR
jgi:hypothetical protein